MDLIGGLGKAQTPLSARPFIGVYFRCAGQYQRVYRNPPGTVYLARCARCGRCVRFRVGPDGLNQRMFEVSCGLDLH